MKYIIKVNDGFFNKGNNNVFNKEELVGIFEEWGRGEKMVDSDGEEVSIDDLIEVGNCGEMIEIYNKGMVEYGDDYVEVGVMEIEIEG